MSSSVSLIVSQSILSLLSVEMSVSYLDRLPHPHEAVIVVSNHRSFMDAPILIQALQRPIRIACHHYMGQTPLLKDMVQLLGCFPLAEPKKRAKQFSVQAQDFLQQHQWVGLFPEGTSPMVQLTAPNTISSFERGFAHLAFQLNIPRLTVLPVAITSLSESVLYPFPLRALRLFDPLEPQFDRPGLQPVVTYHRTHVLIGRPYLISSSSSSSNSYPRKKSKIVINQLVDYCYQEISNLLAQAR